MYDDDELLHTTLPADATQPRLPLLTLSEAHELLEVLRHFAAADSDFRPQARHFAAELAGRIPSQDA